MAVFPCGVGYAGAPPRERSRHIASASIMEPTKEIA